MLNGRLWRSPDFLKLWGGQTVSELGTAVTRLALPLVAIQMLHATPFEVGLLAALQSVPYPVLGLVAGVWADRLPRRPMLIVCDVARMAVLAAIPVSYFLLHYLSMIELYVVGLLLGVFSVFFIVAYVAYLPSLVDRADLIEGNSKLQASAAVAQVLGPGLAGAMIQFLKAPVAILVDSLSYLVSVLTLIWIRSPEPRPDHPAQGQAGFLRELWEGTRYVFGHAIIRLVTAANATSNFGGAVVEAVFLIYAVNQLHLSATTIGSIYAAGAVAAVLGAAVAPRLASHLGPGPLMAVSALLFRITYLAVPVAAFVGMPAYLLGAILVTSRFSELIYNVTQLSLRQAIVPARLQGRSSAVVRTVTWGAIPLGSALGGTLGMQIGLVPTIIVGALLSMVAAAWILAGPVRLREQPTEDAEPPGEQTGQAGAPGPAPTQASRRKFDPES
jgi:MFS family permease